jgi:hypothetical protein
MTASPATTQAESRPHFRERQLLTAAELEREQAYQVAMRRRHLVGSHSWGVVTGLALAAAPDGFAVQPGVAVDGFGRELVVQRPVVLGSAELGELEDSGADVWLLYGRVAATPPVRGRYDCGPGRHSRWREQPCLRFTAAREPFEPRRPPGVTRTSLEFEPHAEPPDTAVPAWPVYLGRLTAVDDEKHPGARTYDVDLGRRPYAGAVGESLRNPRGSEGLRIGGDEGGAAVRLRDAGGTIREALSVDAAGDVTVAADTGLTGDLTVDHPDTESGGLSFTPLAATPEEAAPWRAYRTVVRDAQRSLSQLRLEVGHPGPKGDPFRYALSIGAVDGGAFKRCMTCMSNCTVVVHGDMKVDGLVSLGPLPADPDDARFRSAVLLRWMRGITEAGSSLEQGYAAELALSGLTLTVNFATSTVHAVVTLTNPGPVPLSQVRVTAVLTGGSTDPVVHGTLLDPPTAVEAADSVHPSGDLDASGLAATTAKVTVTAVATGPAGNPLTDSVEASVGLIPPIN